MHGQNGKVGCLSYSNKWLFCCCSNSTIVIKANATQVGQPPQYTATGGGWKMASHQSCTLAWRKIRDRIDIAASKPTTTVCQSLGSCTGTRMSIFRTRYARRGYQACSSGIRGWFCLVKKSVGDVCRSTIGASVPTSQQDFHWPRGATLVPRLLFQSHQERWRLFPYAVKRGIPHLRHP